jgi:uncharacterized protein YkwD
MLNKNLIVVIVAACFLAIVFLSFNTRNENYGKGRNGGAYGTTINEAYADEFQKVVNDFRRNANLGPLEADPVLGEIARTRAAEMASEGKVSLTRPDGSDWSVLLLSAGIKDRVAGENHSSGNLNPERLFQNFIEKPEDRRDFVYDKYTKMGVGAAEMDGKTYVAVYFLTEPIDTKRYAAEVFRLVNREREAAGVPPLLYDEKVAEAAVLRASEVGSLPKHVRPTGAKWNSVFNQQGIEVSIAGENVARGQKDPESVMKDWLASPGHRKNILRPEYEGIGVGVFPTTDGSLAWVQLFHTKKREG